MGGEFSQKRTKIRIARALFIAVAISLAFVSLGNGLVWAADTSLSVNVTVPSQVNRFQNFTATAEITNTGNSTAENVSATRGFINNVTSYEDIFRIVGIIPTGNSTTVNWTLIASSTGNYTIVVFAGGNNTGLAIGSANFSVVDITPPTITITSPQNTTYPTTSLQLNVSANEPISLWQYSLNGAANVSFTPNTTFTAPEGANNITITANDTAGNRNTTTVYFTVDTTPSNVLPVANAGPDQTVNDTDNSGFETVFLNGSGSFDPDGVIINFTWLANGDLNAPTLIGTGEVINASFSVGVHNVTLNVTDDDGASDTDSVLVTVNAPANQPPVANAGPDQTVPDNDSDGFATVILNGFGSFDPDGVIVNYTWREGATLLGTGAVIATNFSVGVHNVTLNVTDDDGASDVDQTVVTVAEVANLSSWAYHANVTITNNNASTSLPTGYTVSLTFDHAALVSANQSLASGDDVRVVYNGATELDRINVTAFNTGTTAILFRTQASIPAGGSASNYEVYYGNPSPGVPLADPNNVYLFYDDFSTNTLGSYSWSGSGLMSRTYDATNQRVRFYGREQGQFSPTASQNWVDVAVQMRVMINLRSQEGSGGDWGNIMMPGGRSTGTFYSGVTGGIFEHEMYTPQSRAQIWDDSGVRYYAAFNYTVGQWYTINTRIYGSNTWLYIDDVLKTSSTGITPTTGGKTTIWVSAGASGNTVGEYFIDDWLVRRYLTPEPSATAPGLPSPPNSPPVANAGPDQTVNDTDNNGFETVFLNGSLSFDPDGVIINFTWLANGDLNAPTLIGTGEVINASFSVGVHNVTLNVTDDDGASDTDSVIVTVVPPAVICPPSNSSLPFFDDFNDGDACGWVVDQGSWSVVNGTYDQSNTNTVAPGLNPALGGRMFSHIDGSNYGDFEAMVEAQVVSSPSRIRELSVIFRATPDLQNFYHVRTWSGSTTGDDHFQIWKYVNGTEIFLQMVPIGYPPDGTWFVFRVSASGSQLKAKIWERGTAEPSGWNLTVTDSSHASGLFALATWSTHGRFDNVNITSTVSPVTNQPPVANAGPDQTVNDTDNNGFETVFLNGSGSFDPDGVIINFTWLANGDLNAPTLIGVGEVINTSFSVGVHNVTLNVTDDDGASDTDSMLVTVNAPVNQPPVANAGPDQTVNDTDNSGFETVVLNGSLSFDPDGAIINFTWLRNGDLNAPVVIGFGEVINTSFSVGVHNVTLNVTDDDGAFSLDYITITVNAVDIAPSIITITSPQNTTYANATVWLNVSANEPISLWQYSLNGAPNVTFTPNTTFTAAEGANTITVTANDTAGNRNTTSISFTVDTTPPLVTVLSPINTTYTNNSVWVNVTLNEMGNNVTAQLDSTTNYTLINSSGNWNRLLTGLGNGAHSVRIFANDSLGNMNSSAIVYFTVSVDTTPPTITIYSPQNITYQTTYFDLNFTAVDASGVEWTGYRFDGGPLITSGNATFYENNNGRHNITVYANDSLANQGSSTVYFTTDVPVIVTGLTTNELSYAPDDRVNILANVANLDNVSHSDLQVNFLVWDPDGVLVHNDTDRTQKLNSEATKRVSTRFSLAPNATLGNYTVEARLSDPANAYDIKRATFQVA